jgi:hypothetical protein
MQFDFVAAPLRGWSPRLAIRIFLNMRYTPIGQDPAQAGIQQQRPPWIPACAGMTDESQLDSGGLLNANENHARAETPHAET